MKKKIISILLVVIMLLGMIPVAAFAGGEKPEHPIYIGTEGYDDLQAAIDACGKAAGNYTITLADDFEMKSCVRFNTYTTSGKTDTKSYVTLDLNGHTLSANITKDTQSKFHADQYCLFIVYNYAGLSIKNGNIHVDADLPLYSSGTANYAPWIVHLRGTNSDAVNEFTDINISGTVGGIFVNQPQVVIQNIENVNFQCEYPADTKKAALISPLSLQKGTVKQLKNCNFLVKTKDADEEIYNGTSYTDNFIVKLDSGAKIESVTGLTVSTYTGACIWLGEGCSIGEINDSVFQFSSNCSRDYTYNTFKVKTADQIGKLKNCTFTASWKFDGDGTKQLLSSSDTDGTYFANAIKAGGGVLQDTSETQTIFGYPPTGQYFKTSDQKDLKVYKINPVSATELTPVLDHGNITLGFTTTAEAYIEDLNYEENDKLKFIICDDDEKVIGESEVEKLDEKTEVKFPVNPAEFTKDFTAKLVNTTKENETKEIGTVSLADYCHTMIENENSPEELVTLCESILDYGCASQDLFLGSHEETDEANLDPLTTDDNVPTAAVLTEANFPKIKADMSFFVLENAKVRLYYDTVFRKDNFSISDPNKIGKVSYGTVEANEDDLKYNYVEIENIKPSDLGKTFTVTLNGQNYSYSALQCVYDIMTACEGQEFNAAGILYPSLVNYYLAANAYFAAE